MLRARNGAIRIVLMLDQRIVARPARLRSAISVAGQGVDGSYNQPGRILGEAYNPRTRSITLVLARRPRLSGSVRLSVHAIGIVNLLGQALDGAGAGAGGSDFLSTLNLP
ncbi:hypothetical protein [Singulisphaera sp. PoT]|uniref:hypothetical protein n=1 Tax=Singulisphaera sp. PoT TaxID=3411797 RepID=UPI003BF5E76F